MNHVHGGSTCAGVGVVVFGPGSRRERCVWAVVPVARPREGPYSISYQVWFQFVGLHKGYSPLPCLCLGASFLLTRKSLTPTKRTSLVLVRFFFPLTQDLTRSKRRKCDEEFSNGLLMEWSQEPQSAPTAMMIGYTPVGVANQRTNLGRELQQHRP